jgi:glycosyltransferase involved in cell wall biosynthesis
MVGRATLYSHPGGDTVQIVKTAKYLNLIEGVKIDVKSVSEKINYENYDLIHLFNICRPFDILPIVSRSKKPFVVSTVFVDFSETEKNHFKKARRLLFKLLGYDNTEYLKALARIIKGQDRFSNLIFFYQGQKKAIQKIIRKATFLLPNSESEYSRLLRAYNTQQCYEVVPNAIDLEIFNQEVKNQSFYDQFKDAIITVGQITPVKNQLNLIKALNMIKVKAFIIGSPASNSLGYYNLCRQTANDNISFIPHVEQENLVSIYKKAKVHALASWFETTGLVSLEAAYSGCNIVVSNRGDQREYFENNAYYCEPSDIQSIYNALKLAYTEAYTVDLKRRIIKDFNWGRAAEITQNVYQKILKDDS